MNISSIIIWPNSNFDEATILFKKQEQDNPIIIMQANTILLKKPVQDKDKSMNISSIIIWTNSNFDEATILFKKQEEKDNPINNYVGQL